MQVITRKNAPYAGVREQDTYISILLSLDGYQLMVAGGWGRCYDGPVTVWEYKLTVVGGLT